MAKTVAHIQKHGYDTQKDLLTALSKTKEKTSHARKSLRDTEQKLREINEQINYTEQYLVHKKIYNQYLSAKNKKRFRQDHSAEIALYEIARKIQKENAGGRKLPSMKMLKAEKEKLSAQKTPSIKPTGS